LSSFTTLAGALSSLGTLDSGAGSGGVSTSGLLSRSSHARVYGQAANDRNAMAQRMAGSVWSGGVDTIISAPEQTSSFVNWLEQTEMDVNLPDGMCLCIYVSMYLCVCVSRRLCTYTPMDPSVMYPMYPMYPMYLRIYLSMYL
jgi:hypothetical protein